MSLKETTRDYIPSQRSSIKGEYIRNDRKIKARKMSETAKGIIIILKLKVRLDRLKIQIRSNKEIDLRK